MEENKKDINIQNREIFYFFIFLTTIIYEDKKFIEVNIKEKDIHIPTDEELNKNDILRNYNKDNYDVLREIYNTEINITIKLDYNKMKKIDEDIQDLFDGYFDGYNIYGIIKKDSVMDKLAKLVIKNKKYISELIDKNNEDKSKSIINKYKRHEKFVEYYEKKKNNEYIPMTYILYCIDTYEKFLKYDSNLSTKSITKQWTSTIKFIKHNIEDIIPKYSGYVFGKEDKIDYKNMMDKLLKLQYDVKTLILEKHYGYKTGLNTFIKGVPGTGKSMKVKQLTSDIKRENILKINIHSDMSSSDIIQGISVNINQYNNLIYKEKYGVILRCILKAILNPSERFAIVLEEIQEKALNKLIGSLIYLIEEDKRVCCDYIKDLSKGKKREIETDKDIDEVFELIDNIINNRSDIESITIPNLIEGSNKERKLILPDNVYFFLTTNYRNDKVVIEDNMLRRFSIIEMYPEYKDTVDYGNDFVSDFLQNLNNNIMKVFSDEIHPERMLIGHASWMRINTCEEFYNNFIKFVVEFNDIRLIEYSQFKQIFNKELWIDFFKYSEREDNKVYKCITNIIKKICDGETNSYFELIYSIQKELRKELQIQ